MIVYIILSIFLSVSIIETPVAYQNFNHLTYSKCRELYIYYRYLGLLFGVNVCYLRVFFMFVCDRKCEFRIKLEFSRRDFTCQLITDASIFGLFSFLFYESLNIQFLQFLYLLLIRENKTINYKQ